MPDDHKLTPELVSLVHHIELDKAGWWDHSAQRLVLTAFWVKRHDIALTITDVANTLLAEFAITLGNMMIEKQIRVLEKSGQLIALPECRFKLCETAAKACEAEITEAVESEAAVKHHFEALLAKSCPDIQKDLAWEAFSDKFLLPLVRELGANTYRFLIGEGLELDLPQLKQFTSCFGASESIRLQSFVREFLDPGNVLVRRYVLRTMNAYFVVQASGLSEETVAKLAKASERPTAVLFFDTNVLFSLLGLHENPADEGSLALLNLVRQLATSVPIRLRVLPPTLDEMKRAITASQESLIELRISPKLMNAAIQAGISGITEKYLRLSASRGGTVAPADYFEPYLKNLLTILRGNGVDLFSEDLSRYTKYQPLIDDLLSQLEFEKQRFGDRAKNYERLQHDLVMWYFVKDKRPPRAESPLEAEFWIVTADYRFLAFDKFKQKKLGTDIPICLHPTTLTQLLQFWVPRTPQFEEALLSTMRLPTVFTLDADTERISLQILNALSTFENIGDLPTETTTRVLLNEALRQKITVEHDVSKQVDLVREALIEENKKAEQRLEEARLRSQQLSQSTEGIQKDLALALAQVSGLRSELERERNGSAKDREQANSTKKKLDDFLEQRKSRNSRAKFVIASFLFLIGFVLTSCLSSWHFHYRARWLILSLMVILSIWLTLTHFVGIRLSATKDWDLFRRFLGFKTWVYSSVFAGLLVSLLWDALKSLWE